MKRRNRLIVLLFALLMTFGLTSCGDSDVGEPASGAADYLGTYTETTFQNERFGILFTIPAPQFEFAMLDDILKANDIDKDDFSNTRVPEIVASGKNYMVMYGGDTTNQNSTAVVIAALSGDDTPEAFVQDAAAKIKTSLENDESITIKECELKTGSPIGYDKYLVYTFSANDQTFYTEQFFAFADVDMASITISSTSEGQIMTMHSAWTRLK